MEVVEAGGKGKRVYVHVNASERRLEPFHKDGLSEEGLVLE